MHRTPGKWVALIPPNGSPPHRDSRVVVDGNSLIQIARTNRYDLESKADARLMAASPIMLDALNASLEAFRLLYDAIDSGVEAEDLLALPAWPLTQIRDAIAAATDTHS